MPSQLTRKIFPSFHHQLEKDKEDNASTMSRRSSMTLVNPDSFSIRSPSPPRAELQNHLPFGPSGEDKAGVPRTTIATDKTNLENAVAASQLINQSDIKGTDPAPYSVDTFVKVCLHEILSFERLQTIMKLSRFKSDKIGIDAIGGTKEKQHTQWSEILDRTCHPNGDSYSYPRGTFKLKWNSKHHGWRGPVIGLELHVTWTLDHYETGATKKLIQTSFNNLEKVALCPHKMINDAWILETIYIIAHPPAVSSDPIDQWKKKISSGP